MHTRLCKTIHYLLLGRWLEAELVDEAVLDSYQPPSLDDAIRAELDDYVAVGG